MAVIINNINGNPDIRDKYIGADTTKTNNIKGISNMIKPNNYNIKKIDKDTINDNINEKVVGKTTYTWEVIDGGRQGITVNAKTIIKEATDNKEAITHEETYHLPPVIARVWDGEATYYLIPSPIATEAPISVKGSQLVKPDFWNDLDNYDYAEAMKVKALQEIFRRNAEENIPKQPISPSIREGIPPLLPLSLAPQKVDGKAACEAYGFIGHKLSPIGRFVVGLALVSAFIKEIGGESSYCHFNGEGSAGKSILGRAIAGLFGNSEKGKGLLISFNASRLGIPATVVEYSYLPPILDELNTATAEPMETITNVIMGAQRLKASRQGGSSKPRGEWRGMIYSTGNTPPSINGERHEMFDRRYFTIQADQLWDTKNIPQEWEKKILWWKAISDAIETGAGWPWYEFCKQFTPGEESIETFINYFNAKNGDAPILPIIAEGNLGKIGQLGIAGCMWLSYWTGDTIWETGIVEAAAKILFERSLEKTDAGRDTVNKIMSDYNANPGLYPNSNDERLPVSPHGVIIDNDSGKCGMDHDGNCEWINVLATTVETLTGVKNKENKRLSNNGNWKNVMPQDNPTSKRITYDGKKIYVYKICFKAAIMLNDTNNRIKDEQKPKIADTKNIFKNNMGDGND